VVELCKWAVSLEIVETVVRELVVSLLVPFALREALPYPESTVPVTTVGCPGGT
jgi:hypothetical protein